MSFRLVPKSVTLDDLEPATSMQHLNNNKLRCRSVMHVFMFYGFLQCFDTVGLVV